MSHLDSVDLPELELLHIQESVTDTGSFLDILPWDDIIFKYIFPGLNLKTLFRLRAVNRLFQDCLTEYFLHMKRLVIYNMGPKFSAPIFHIITADNRSLQNVVIRNSSNWISDENILPIIEQNSKLKSVDLSENSSLTNRTIQRLVVVSGRGLRTLVLRDCSWLSSDVVSQIAINCLGLEKLDITGCWDIQDVAIINLARMCRRLKHLAVAKIYGLTDQSICEVARNMSELSHLNIQGCWRVTDKSVFLLTEYCKSLKVLQAKECRDISMTCLERLKEKGIRVDLLSGKKKQLSVAQYKYMKGLPM